jgi:hypothetical protein
MAEIRVSGTLSYDDELMHGGDTDSEAYQWFIGKVLLGGSLSIHDNGETGDRVGLLKDVQLEHSDVSTCRWYPDPDEFNNIWGTECFNAVSFEVDGPVENGYIHCPYCGSKILLEDENGGGY